MKKLLLIALLVVTSAVAEVNKSIVIANCSKFLDDPAKCIELFEKAAKKAKIPGFLLYDATSSSGINYKYFVNHVGYISMMINPDENKLYIDFYCADDSFDYTKFITHFVKGCYRAEKPHVPTIIFENEGTNGAYLVVEEEDFFDRLLDSEFAADMECM